MIIIIMNNIIINKNNKAVKSANFMLSRQLHAASPMFLTGILPLFYIPNFHLDRVLAFP